MAQHKKQTVHTIIIERKYSNDKVKAIDLFTRLISDNIIRENPNVKALKEALSESTILDPESC